MERRGEQRGGAYWAKPGWFGEDGEARLAICAGAALEGPEEFGTRG